MSVQASSKNYGTAVCLAGIFGILGIHHFYLGRWLHGLFDLSLSVIGITLIVLDQLFLGWALLIADIIHTIAVTIMLLIGSYKDGQGKTVTYPGQQLPHI